MQTVSESLFHELGTAAPPWSAYGSQSFSVQALQSSIYQTRQVRDSFEDALWKQRSTADRSSSADLTTNQYRSASANCVLQSITDVHCTTTSSHEFLHWEHKFQYGFIKSQFYANCATKERVSHHEPAAFTDESNHAAPTANLWNLQSFIYQEEGPGPTRHVGSY